MLTISMKTFAKIQYFLIQFFCFRIFFCLFTVFSVVFDRLRHRKNRQAQTPKKKQTAKKNTKATSLPFCWFCNSAGLSMSICNNTQQKK